MAALIYLIRVNTNLDVVWCFVLQPQAHLAPEPSFSKPQHTGTLNDLVRYMPCQYFYTVVICRRIHLAVWLQYEVLTCVDICHLVLNTLPILFMIKWNKLLSAIEMVILLFHHMSQKMVHWWWIKIPLRLSKYHAINTGTHTFHHSVIWIYINMCLHGSIALQAWLFSYFPPRDYDPPLIARRIHRSQSAAMLTVGEQRHFLGLMVSTSMAGYGNSAY